MIQHVTGRRGQDPLGRGSSCDAGPVREPVVLCSEVTVRSFETSETKFAHGSGRREVAFKRLDSFSHREVSCEGRLGAAFEWYAVRGSFGCGAGIGVAAGRER